MLIDLSFLHFTESGGNQGGGGGMNVFDNRQFQPQQQQQQQMMNHQNQFNAQLSNAVMRSSVGHSNAGMMSSFGGNQDQPVVMVLPQSQATGVRTKNLSLKTTKQVSTTQLLVLLRWRWNLWVPAHLFLFSSIFHSYNFWGLAMVFQMHYRWNIFFRAESKFRTVRIFVLFLLPWRRYSLLSVHNIKTVTPYQP